MRLCIAGKNSVAVDAAEHVRTAFPDLELCLAANQTDDGEDHWQPSLIRWGKNHGVSVVELAALYPIEDLIFISLEFDRLLKPELFASRQLYNIHFSLLPEYKGSLTSIWPLLDGKDYSGVTLHRIDSGIDTGDIIAQMRFPIPLDFNSRALYGRYLEEGGALFRQWLPQLLAGDVPSHPQPAFGATFRSRRSLDFSQLKIDFRRTAFEVHNQVRAYAFREYQLPSLGGIALAGSEILAQRSSARPGTVVEETEHSLVVATVDFDVRLWKDVLDVLLASCERGDIEAVRRYVLAKPNLNARNTRGWSPLMVAAYHGHRAVVEVLLQAGADLHQTNYKGTSVLMYAKSAAERDGDTTLLQLLLDKGAAINARDRTGKTILSYARENSSQHHLADWFSSRGATL